MENEVITTNKNNNIKIIIYIVIVIGVIVLSFTGGMLFERNRTKTNDNSTTDSEKLSDNTTTEEYTFNNFDPKTVEIKGADNDELANNIEIKEIFFNPKNVDYGANRTAYIYGKNNNQQPVHIRVSIEYYDDNGKRIDENYGTNAFVYANTEFSTEVNIKDDSAYKTAKILYKCEKAKSYETVISADEIETENHLTNDKNITFFITNKSNIKGYFDTACIYYKNGDIVYVDSSNYISIDVGEKIEGHCYNYKLKLNNDYKNPKYIEYDDYKFYVHGARNVDNKNY